MTARLASRYAAALEEARKGAASARKTLDAHVNFGDHRDPEQLAWELFDKAACLSAAADHYRAAARAVRGRQETEEDGW